MTMTTEIEKGVTYMSSLGEAIYQNGKAEGMVEGKADCIIVCMNSNSCSVEEALDRIGYDHAEWPELIKAVDARLARERAEAEQATA